MKLIIIILFISFLSSCKFGGSKPTVQNKNIFKNVNPPTDCSARLGSDINQEDSKDKYPYLTPAQGAWKIMATKYQTCDILKNEPDGKTQPPQSTYMDQLAADGKYPVEGCTDQRNADHLPYKLGPDFQTNHQSVDVYRNVDCSGFISGAFFASGLKMTMESTPQNYRRTTSTIVSDYKSGKSCFEKPKNSIDDLLKEGDMFNMKRKKKLGQSASGHVVMIDRVGDDPLGVKKVVSSFQNKQSSKEEALKKCSALNKSDMDFGVIHSSTARVSGSGVIKTNFSAYNSDTATQLVLKARKACKHFIEKPGEGYLDPTPSGTGGNLLRHKGAVEPKCIFPPNQYAYLPASSCLNGCYKNKAKNFEPYDDSGLGEQTDKVTCENIGNTARNLDEDTTGGDDTTGEDDTTGDDTSSDTNTATGK